MPVRSHVFDSTAVERARYDTDEGRLELWYVGGDSYTYFDVPVQVYESLVAAPSAGAFVNELIKPNFRYEIQKRRRRFRPD